MDQPKNGWKIKIINKDTNEEIEIDLDQLNYEMRNDLIEVPNLGRFYSGHASKGFSFYMSGYFKNPNFDREYQEAMEE